MSPSGSRESRRLTPDGASEQHSTRLSWMQGLRVAWLLRGGRNRWRPGVVHRCLVTLRRVELQRRIVEGAGEFLLFALTPPRLTTGPEHARQIAAETLERLCS